MAKLLSYFKVAFQTETKNHFQSMRSIDRFQDLCTRKHSHHYVSSFEFWVNLFRNFLLFSWMMNNAGIIESFFLCLHWKDVQDFSIFDFMLLWFQDSGFIVDTNRTHWTDRSIGIYLELYDEALQMNWYYSLDGSEQLTVTLESIKLLIRYTCICLVNPVTRKPQKYRHVFWPYGFPTKSSYKKFFWVTAFWIWRVNIFFNNSFIMIIFT